MILDPTTMQVSAKNKMVKNDRMDALNIAKNLTSGSYKAVYVPDEEDVEIKEYIRMIHAKKTQGLALFIIRSLIKNISL